MGFGFGLLAATSVSASSACVARGAEWCEAGLEVEVLLASSALVIDSCTLAAHASPSLCMLSSAERYAGLAPGVGGGGG